MNRLLDLLRRTQDSGILLLVLSAILFVVGAASFEGNGFHNLATLGIGAAVAALAILAAFR